MTYHKKLNDLLFITGLNKKQLAKKLGIKHVRFWKICNSKYTIKRIEPKEIKAMIDFANKFDVDLQYNDFL